MPFADLRRRLDAEGLHVAGLLSGTSADGIDVGVAHLRRRPGDAGAPGTWDAPRLLHFETRPFAADLHRRLRAVLDGAPTGLREAALLHRDLGRAFGEALDAVRRARDLPVDLVGSHGQTVWHHDDVEPSGPATLQLGDGDEVAERAGRPVVCDFRSADVAAGGGGAPLSLYGDEVLFAAAPRPLCVLNLGGLGNLTWLDGDDARAFDTGPAGCLLDGLARRLLDRPYDAGGAAAARGEVRAAWVEALGRHPFLSLAPPRSTGRDTFGEAWLDGALADPAAAGARPEDLLRSAARFVAACVERAVREHLPARPARLWVAGGGVHHGPLMGDLGELLGCPVGPTEGAGVPAEAREALVFAVLAARSVAGEGVTRPGATGARAGRVLGKWVPGPGPGTPSGTERGANP